LKTAPCLPLFLFIMSCLFMSSEAIASRPGGGDEGPHQCTVMGQVIRTQADPSTATVRLREVTGSTTYMGCTVTGAMDMAAKNTAVTVSLDIVPKPVIETGDIVFVNIRETGDAQLQTFAPGEYTLDMLRGEVQIYFEDRLQRLKFVYAIRSYLGLGQTIAQLVPDLIEADSEKRLSAALMLIVLADAHHAVPSEALQKALRIGLMESRKTAVGNSIRLFPGEPGQTANMLAAFLRDPEVKDPFATIVAMGELGPVAQAALPDAIDRLDDPHISQVRGGGDEIFATAVGKMKAEDKAAKIFLARVKEGKLRDREGPLAKGMCRLKTDNTDLAAWCKSGSGLSPSGCKEALERMQKFLSQLQNTCAADSDCDGYYFPVGGPDCPRAWFLPKSVMTDDVKEGGMKQQAIVRAACAAEWENRHAVCSPPPWQIACREGKCVDLLAK
jgi:hypothetical protein